MDLGERVWFDRDQVQAVVNRLRTTVPPGTHWGFNYEGDRAWAVAEASVDLEAVVAEALPPAIKLARRLREAGVPVAEEADSIYVADPFGNRVELLERGDTLSGPP